MKEALHSTHPAIIKRLRRAGGHLQSVIGMFEDGRPCLDLAQQLHAVEKAIAEAKKTLIRDHLDHCLGEAAESLPDAQKQSIAEFKAIAKYL
ncbi:metal-sensing transcriptional repressor [Chelativorans sp. AA-79]|uniref:metal-sensing transcriptional repressor n=1 Tax=Chelativorans sp. AA-79 TaxID=3028735 RepID=UPI0023F95218|nr:metal-sensing transcriptional repressor [Chelativorans sp. AA-79]WEX12128.1 metal-sensing transcriptional repressor [Chelativorans sp. AA-79]